MVRTKKRSAGRAQRRRARYRTVAIDSQGGKRAHLPSVQTKLLVTVMRPRGEFLHLAGDAPAAGVLQELQPANGVSQRNEPAIGTFSIRGVGDFEPAVSLLADL